MRILIKQAKVFQTALRRFETNNVLVEDNRFVYVGAEESFDNVDKVIDGMGQYMVPGLVDIHMHIESSMTTPELFSQAVLPFGTTTIVADPHEMANVFGLDGVNAFMERQTILDIFYGIPSSVPSTNPGLETTGGILDVPEVKELAKDPRVICFGEVMNYKELIAEGATKTKNMIAAFKEIQPLAPVEGHCPKIWGEELAQFIAAGVDSDHTHQSRESILAKVPNGMFLEIQNKSITTEVIQTLIEYNLYDHFCFITDDIMPDRLVDGHLNLHLLKAVAHGMRIEDAIYCSTYTPTRRMQLYDYGQIAPGRIADFILLENLAEWDVAAVYKHGKEVFGNGVLQPEPMQPDFATSYTTSIQRAATTPEDFILHAPAGTKDSVTARVMRKVLESTFTEEVHHKLPVAADGSVTLDSSLSLVTVIERYGNHAPIAYGILQNGLDKPGAIATSWAHDHHNILTVGMDAIDTSIAVNRIIELQGGIVVVENGKILAEVALPIGGIVSLAPMDELAKDVEQVRAAMQHLGYYNQDEIMSLATISLLVSPALKMSDKGLIDVRKQEILPLFLSEEETK